MAVHDDAPAPAGGDDGSVFLKGAPDRLLDLCTHEIAPGGGVRGLDRGFWEAEIDRLSGRGPRVLAGAFRRGGASESDGDLDENDVALGGFTFAGLYGIIDPPRPEAIEAVARCRAAGIRVKMIPGDHAGTDPATGEIPAITGRELEAMDGAELARAVREGRAIHDNLRKTIVYMLPTNGSEALVMFAAVMANMTLPLTPLQILWVNMVCAVTLGVALAFEGPEPDVMDRPPRDPGEPLLDAMAGIRIAVVSLLLGGMTMAVFHWAVDGGTAVRTARTLAVNALVAGQIWYLFNARHLREHSFRADLFTTNPASWIAVAALVALQLLFTYAPFMHAAFGSAPLGAAQWGLIVALGAAVFGVIEGEKALGRVIRRSGRRPGRRAPSPRRPATRP